MARIVYPDTSAAFIQAIENCSVSGGEKRTLSRLAFRDRLDRGAAPLPIQRRDCVLRSRRNCQRLQWREQLTACASLRPHSLRPGRNQYRTLACGELVFPGGRHCSGRITGKPEVTLHLVAGRGRPSLSAALRACRKAHKGLPQRRFGSVGSQVSEARPFDRLSAGSGGTRPCNGRSRRTCSCFLA